MHSRILNNYQATITLGGNLITFQQYKFNFGFTSYVVVLYPFYNKGSQYTYIKEIQI